MDGFFKDLKHFETPGVLTVVLNHNIMTRRDYSFAGHRQGQRVTFKLIMASIAILAFACIIFVVKIASGDR